MKDSYKLFSNYNSNYALLDVEVINYFKLHK